MRLDRFHLNYESHPGSTEYIKEAVGRHRRRVFQDLKRAKERAMKLIAVLIARR